MVMGSFGRLVAMMILLGVCSCIQSSDAAHCPPPNWVKPTRNCLSDKECYPNLCCPDFQGRKSCAPSQSGFGAAGRAGYGVNVVICDNVKCKPYEICKMDPKTKKNKCSRP